MKPLYLIFFFVAIHNCSFGQNQIIVEDSIYGGNLLGIPHYTVKTKGGGWGGAGDVCHVDLTNDGNIDFSLQYLSSYNAMSGGGSLDLKTEGDFEVFIDDNYFGYSTIWDLDSMAYVEDSFVTTVVAPFLATDTVSIAGLTGIGLVTISDYSYSNMVDYHSSIGIFNGASVYIGLKGVYEGEEHLFIVQLKIGDGIVEVVKGYTTADIPNEISVFPNPTDEFINTKGVYNSAQLYNLQGQPVTQLLDYPLRDHSMSHLISGMYYIRFDMPNGDAEVKQLIKN